MPALLLGYGATRLLQKSTMTDADARVVRVETSSTRCFPYDPTAWLLSLDQEGFDDVAENISHLLALDGVATMARDDDRVFLRQGRSKSDIASLSDGYQSMLVLAFDILRTVLTMWGSTALAEGIVLIDELGAQLHPRWRMRIVSALRQLMPRVQFIVTTHDPLCLRGVADGEVVVVRRNSSGDVVTIVDLPPVAGMRVDQLLTSDHFGLGSTDDPELDGLWSEYYRLKGKDRVTSAKAGRRDAVRTRLDQLEQFGTTKHDRLLLQSADTFIAQRREHGDKAVPTSAEVNAELADLWSANRAVPLSAFRGRPAGQPVQCEDAHRAAGGQGLLRRVGRQGEVHQIAAYKADDVKATLEQAFRGKCAYCESAYSAAQPMAVEHYRPKGEVVIAGKRTPPGYYWLASAWDNLLPSCTDCNSPRRQVLPDGPQWPARPMRSRLPPNAPGLPHRARSRRSDGWCSSVSRPSRATPHVRRRLRHRQGRGGSPRPGTPEGASARRARRRSRSAPSCARGWYGLATSASCCSWRAGIGAGGEREHRLRPDAPCAAPAVRAPPGGGGPLRRRRSSVPDDGASSRQRVPAPTLRREPMMETADPGQLRASRARMRHRHEGRDHQRRDLPAGGRRTRTRVRAVGRGKFGGRDRGRGSGGG